MRRVETKQEVLEKCTYDAWLDRSSVAAVFVVVADVDRRREEGGGG